MKGLETHIITDQKDLPPLDNSNFFHSRQLFEIARQTPRQKPYMVVVQAADGQVLAHLLAIVRYRASLLPPYFYMHCRILGEGVYTYPHEGQAENALFGIHIEDSLYAATYDAFREDRYQEVQANTQLATERFPLGQNQPKFLFISGLSKLNEGDGDGCVELLKQVVEKYPKSEVSEIAGMIVKGVQEGRPLHGGKFDLGDIWSRRDVVMVSNDSTTSDSLSAERNTNFVFLLVYEPDSVNENQLLFEMARYNFTNFLVRNFDLSIEQEYGLHRMLISGFLNYDEALQYARKLYASETMTAHLKKCNSIIVSQQNLALIGTRFSYGDYLKFYEETFSPLQVSSEQLLNIPEVVAQPDEDREETYEEESDDAGEQQGGGLDFGEDFW